MYNSFNDNGFNNTYKTVSQNFNTGNVAGINKSPTTVAGVNSTPTNVAGINNTTPNMQNKFNTLPKQEYGAKQVMNSQGQNIIHNEFRGINN